MSKNLSLTTEQELSLRTDRHISVTANAGSGKTFVLVNRYKKIINQTLSAKPDMRIDPSRILAITFTKKAAAEMQKKVINSFDRELDELQRDAKVNKQKLDELRRIREGLSYANISTIHSFCSSLLRQFPIEAGVPVNFTEFSEAEKLRLNNSSVINTLEDWLGTDASKVDRDNAEVLLEQFTRNMLIKIVSFVLDKIELFDKLDLLYSKSLEEIEAEVYEYIEENHNLSDLNNNIFQIAELLAAPDLIDDKHKRTDTAVDIEHAVVEFAPSVLKYKDKKNTIEDFVCIVDSFIELSNPFYTKTSDTLNKRISKWISSESTNDLLENQNEFIAEIRKLNILLQTINNLPDFVRVVKALWEFTGQVRKTIDDEKYYLNCLDFNDLQLKAYELLQKPEVIEKISSQIDFIMIDEFQDTNELQYNIVKSLVPELFDKSEKDGINLFIVGDAKQSIYGFRNADVRVFNKTVEDILIRNSYLEKQKTLLMDKPNLPERKIDHDEILGKNRLTSTFRLRPEIAAFVNNIFSRIMQPSLSTFEVEYTPLVCAKDTDRINLNKNNSIVKDYFMGEVVLLISESSKEKQNNEVGEDESGVPKKNILKIDPEADSSEYPEENMIAQYIISKVGTILNETEKKIDYKDIAILCRKRNNFSKLASELLVQGIPFHIHSGRGFYDTEEISDFITFLNFIYNPDDDAALISLLRSPFFNISDTVIFNVRFSAGGETIWQKLNSSSLSSTNDELVRTIEILKEILSISSSMSISKIILMIMEKTGWSALIATKPGSHQRIANLDKFIESARSYEDIGFKNIYDFVEELKFISENSVDENEAAILTDENAVNIMTVHASKGLQFPIVILYDINSRMGGNNQFTLTEDFGLGFKFRKNALDVFDKRIESTINLINKDIMKLSETAEEKRVLYVAMTRAEEILVLSINLFLKKGGEIGKPQGQLKLLLDGLDLPIEELSEESNIEFDTQLAIRKNKKIIDTTYSLSIQKQFHTFEETDKVTSISEDAATPMILLDKIKSVQKREIFSPTKITSFEGGQDLFVNRYILGMPEDFGVPEDVNLEDSEYVGKDIGLVIHKVLERFPVWMKEVSNPDVEALKQEIVKATISSRFDEKNSIHSRVFKECMNVAKTNLIAREYRNILGGIPEYSLSLPLNDNIISGIIDLYIKNVSGDYEIWDWKSNFITTKKEMAELAEHYKTQMQVYAFLISKLNPEQKSFTTRLLFTHLAKENCEDETWTYTFNWSNKELKIVEQGLESKIAEIRKELYIWLD